MLKEIFIHLLMAYNSDDALCKTYWNEVESAYTGRQRHYHNLLHLQQMYTQLEACRDYIEDWPTILFALFYHDLIYKARRRDNEAQSALTAARRLKAINYPQAKIALCSQHILATKSHVHSKSTDTNYFTDADLSILGSDSATYNAYAHHVRNEYKFYPGFLYKPSR
ncbi:hypothetical protein I5907_06745 [Panacibacter sp. DH6]|uniref:Metal-dependent HD superfamily phosphohydrolase n=1 Tax=Panacibacter microcysteis TaxID=2793269 RepID=A0A931GV10_9BACT|nr:hypothetical protein [Panacibacter microcysteis]MBG9375925.1 hypothetical protein [Panacibacter microcysteis]